MPTTSTNHWQTFGPLFRDLHLMFDEFAKDVLETIDELAERIRMIGPNVENVQLKQMQESANVHSAGADQSMREMIEEADANLMMVIKDMRQAAASPTRITILELWTCFQNGPYSREARVVSSPGAEEERWTGRIRSCALESGEESSISIITLRSGPRSRFRSSASPIRNSMRIRPLS